MAAELAVDAGRAMDPVLAFALVGAVGVGSQRSMPVAVGPSAIAPPSDLFGQAIRGESRASARHRPRIARSNYPLEAPARLRANSRALQGSAAPLRLRGSRLRAQWAFAS